MEGAICVVREWVKIVQYLAKKGEKREINAKLDLEKKAVMICTKFLTTQHLPSSSHLIYCYLQFKWQH
jgi:hypothetical protein